MLLRGTELWQNLELSQAFSVERISCLKVYEFIDKTWFFCSKRLKLVVNIFKHCFQLILRGKLSIMRRENSRRLFRRTKQPPSRRPLTPSHFPSIYFLSQNFAVAFVYIRTLWVYWRHRVRWKHVGNLAMANIYKCDGTTPSFRLEARLHSTTFDGLDGKKFHDFSRLKQQHRMSPNWTRVSAQVQTVFRLAQILLIFIFLYRQRMTSEEYFKKNWKNLFSFMKAIFLQLFRC